MTTTDRKPVRFENREALDAAFRAALKESQATFKTVTCPRCGGKGEDYFLGSDRAPGQCFACAGTRFVIARRDVRAARLAARRVDLWYRRCLHFILVAELEAATAELAARDHWSTRHRAEEAKLDIERNIKAGRELAMTIRAEERR